MEAVFLVQPLIQTRAAIDCCKLCFQERDNKAHIECKRAHLAAYSSILAVLRLEKGAEFEEAFKQMENARTQCVSTIVPDESCHGQSQEALTYTLGLYDRILEDYKKRLPNKTSPTPRM